MKRMRKGTTWNCIALAVLMALGLTGCGASSQGAETEAAVADSAYVSDDMYSYDNGKYEETASEEASDQEYDSAAGSTETAEKVQDTGRKLIKNVEMTVETEEFDALLTNVEKRIEALGGYIEASNVYNGSTYNSYNNGRLRSADITARIPAGNLDEFLSLVSESSNVISKNENVTDVTLQYVDMQSHKEALQTEQQRLLELLEQAETIDDIITLESRLSDVRYQIESMESQLRTFDNQVSYSTVYLYINEVKTYTQVEEQTRLQRMTSGFVNSLKGIGNGFLDFGVSFIIALPYLVVWAVIIAVMILLIRLIAKKSKKNSEKRALKQQIKERERQAAYEAHRKNIEKESAQETNAQEPQNHTVDGFGQEKKE